MSNVPKVMKRIRDGWINSNIYRLVFTKPNKHYWFKRRRYGWGWTPVTWQGWIVVLSALLLILVNSTYMNTRLVAVEHIILFTVNTVAIIVVLFLVSYAKGPTPKWRWGTKSHDNPREDI